MYLDRFQMAERSLFRMSINDDSDEQMLSFCVYD